MTALRTRRPTGAGGWQRVLFTGDEASIGDAAWAAASFTGDARLVTSYWLELNTGSTGDIYGAAPDADFELLDHDGTWADIIGQVDAAWEVAREVAATGGMPSALIVNTMSSEWMMLSNLGDRRARRRTASELIRHGLDPAAAYSSEVKVEIDADLWTLLGNRHRQLMTKILTWPGPVIMIAREKRNADGRWVLKAQDQLGFDVTAWIRYVHGAKPEIVSFQTPERTRLNATQRRQLRANFSPAAIVWDWSGCTVNTPMPVVRVLDADQTMPGEEPPVRAVPGRQTVAPRPLPPPPSAAPEPSQDEIPASTDATIVSLVDRLLTLDKRAGLNGLWAEMEQAGAAAMAKDVKGLLTPEERSVLNLADSTAVSLRGLATEVGRHVHKTSTAVRDHIHVGVAS
ncbi:hypothetical protein [Lentzea sp. NPDC092896]|uniref:hypothetical protein n=1 Tax=Lentzea sp. NPDC092896 TaxID=3364127 RepID=UPI0037FEBF2C